MKPLASSHGRLREGLVMAGGMPPIRTSTTRHFHVRRGPEPGAPAPRILEALVDELIDKGLSPFVLLVASPRSSYVHRRFARAITKTSSIASLRAGIGCVGLDRPSSRKFIGNYDELRWRSRMARAPPRTLPDPRLRVDGASAARPSIFEGNSMP